MSKPVNFIAYQLGWFACVLGAAWGWPWVGTVYALLVLAWHLHGAAQPRAELLLALLAAVMGALWDTALASANLVQFANGTFVAGTAPHWMVALWLLFATTLNRSLAWLKSHLAYAALLGAVGGPLAYWAGARAGALALPDPTAALAVLALGWAVITPVLCLAARRLDGYPRAAPSSAQVCHA